MSLHHIIYQSQATTPMADQELRTLLAQARAFNSTSGITGVLLYHGGQFVQVMEGTEGVLRPLYEHIRRDARHTGVVKLADSALENRSFGDWSMAFRPVQAAAFGALSGFLHPDELPRAETPANSLLAQIVGLTFHAGAEAW